MIRILSLILLLLTLVLVGALVACSSCFVKPNTNPSAPPTLTIKVYDYTFTTCTQASCMGCCSQLQSGAARTDSCPYSHCNPITLKYSAQTPNWYLSDIVRPDFDSLIMVIANDPTGVQQLTATYEFRTCPSPDGSSWNVLPLKSFNNGGYVSPSNIFTMNSKPSPQTNNQVLNELAFPITITTKDLKSIACPSPPGGNSSGVGFLLVSVQANNFSSTVINKTSQGVFALQIGPAPFGPAH